ncbi:hypothetical protein FHS82_003498 [Pseudochelatococcus lubricantis]|uniref:DUF2092 domain-containing protein n=1 Tax=Pseudochelatococcus lubricantis TaxID=1538102 RepID=A0ABX0V5P8_9HYPH|nr:hypothetical protein [Pseudochelatococcus lubricantis]NIJ59640.1 hypothetical protein [Pseudochelatococcus lubricantis]
MPRITPVIAIAVLGLLAATVATVALAQTKKGPAMTTAAPDVSAAVIRQHLPAGYREAGRRAAAVDGEHAELVRYERADGRNAFAGGEHFSTIVAADGRLKGFARMDLDLMGGDLPSREEAREIAMAFLRQAAPDLLPGLQLSWIEPHDEPLRVTRDGRAENLTLTGMKVKMRNTVDGRWFWVIVGPDRKAMVFERDIVWITLPGHRQTEKWLHDGWLVEQGHAAKPAAT